MVNKLKNLISNFLNISNTNTIKHFNSSTKPGLLFKEQYQYQDPIIKPTVAHDLSANTWQAFLKRSYYPQMFILFFIFSVLLSVAFTDYSASMLAEYGQNFLNILRNIPANTSTILSSKLCSISELEVLTSRIDDLQKATELALKQSEGFRADVLSVKDSIADLQKATELVLKNNANFSEDVLSVKDSIADLQKATELVLKNNANFSADVLSVKDSIDDLQKSVELISKKNNSIESSITSINKTLKSQAWLDFFDALGGRRPPRF